MPIRDHVEDIKENLMSIFNKTGLFLGLFTLLVGPLLLPDSTPTCPEPAAPVAASDTVALPLDEAKSIDLTTLLEFASETLNYPLLYSGEAMANIRYKFTSPVQVPREDFQGFFERLLLGKGFAYLQCGSGASVMHRVIDLRNAARDPLLMVSSIEVPPEKLDSFRNRGILITIHVPLKNISSRNLLSSLTPFFMQSHANLESMRNVDDSNAVIITSFAYKACAIEALIRRMDDSAAGAREGVVNELMKSKSRIASLEKRVAALEKYLKEKK